MIPLTRDAGHTSFSLLLAVTLRHIVGCIFLCVLWAKILPVAPVAAMPPQSQDSNAKPASSPASQQPAASSPNSAPPVPAETKPSQKAVHQKKVLTEDDLVKPAEPISLTDLDGEENNPACDHSCEAVLRAEMGYGPEREAEFRNQLTLVRHEMSYDRAWTSNLQDVLEAATGYCDIQRQVDKIVGKGAVSTYTRNDVHSRFADREKKLISQYRSAKGLLTQHIEAVQRFAPLRATVMQYQLDGAVARACPDYTLP
jgi:hypothetical protein